ncbi:MAG: aspartate carbamoyltransferase catalytic subunit [Holophagales bacterium]|nr:aspartate carbamoyltransferase catalytic subunit [Holophagales bacterium]MXX60557.1 aspartate carbamoyltransferase catalytic subunit [Holophagales bacterium]MYC08554.1 aspartate carbamoyltransferase catalytic subunit [Holophagales bacterium]MYD23592.1 aspartate carbamoyltransferase catalytic subunit [Holophagales bacterium]MYI33840.1 aspartate carbamoyltransferase catalytic subunit [Holophagales bacterium]
MSEPVWQRGDLLGVAELSTAEILHVLDTAESFVEVAARPIKKVPTLRGKTVINLFFEPSTRTSSSFEIAEKRLSADNINFSTSSSSLSKGETLLDTARNLEAMAPDLVVIRHAHPRVPHALAERIAAGVINAGDGAHEHPTQALLDAFTIRRRKGRVEGLKIAIVGDVAHSRVVRSNVLCLTRLGADVTVAGPRTMMPEEPESLGARVVYSLEEAIEGADVVMMLRVQLERQARASFPSEREYFEFFGLTAERLRGARDEAIIMHPGPINRGIEIASDVADGPWSVILEQVANGVAVRMAVLYLLAGAKSGADGTMP